VELKDHLLKGNLSMLLLKLFDEKAMYGFEVAQELEERTETYLKIKEGSLYPTLRTLEEKGLLKSWWKDGTSGHKRRYYKLTAAGKKELTSRTDEWKAFSKAINKVVIK
jgi:PadR family transcriptional regulator PadR